MARNRVIIRIMNRPNQRHMPPPLTEEQIMAAVYKGSAEHKIERWWGGLPGAKLGAGGKVKPRPKKPKTTICPLVSPSDRDRATLWVQDALRSGNFKYVESTRAYPKKDLLQRRQRQLLGGLGD